MTTENSDDFRPSSETIRTPMSTNDTSMDSPQLRQLLGEDTPSPQPVETTETRLLATAQKLVTSSRKFEGNKNGVDSQNDDRRVAFHTSLPPLDPLSVLHDLDDDSKISKHLEELQLKENDTKPGSKTGTKGESDNAQPSTSGYTIPKKVNRVDTPTIVITPSTPLDRGSTKPNSKRPRVDSDEVLEPLRDPDDHRDWDQIVEDETTRENTHNPNYLSEFQQELRDVRRYLPEDLMLHYKDARKEVRARAIRTERVKYIEKCMKENVIIKELQYFPRVPQGVDLTTQEILHWESQLKAGERGMQSQYRKTLTRLASQSDVAASKKLIELQSQCKSYGIPDKDLRKVLDIMSDKIGRERAKYKINLQTQFKRASDEYKNTIQNHHFLRRGGAKKQPSRPTPRGRSPAKRPQTPKPRPTSTQSRPGRRDTSNKKVSTQKRDSERQSPPTHKSQNPWEKLQRMEEQLQRQEERIKYLQEYPPPRSRSPLPQRQRNRNRPYPSPRGRNRQPRQDSRGRNTNRNNRPQHQRAQGSRRQGRQPRY